MAPQDPLRSVISMGEQFRQNVSSVMRQAARQVQGTLPQLPLPGGAQLPLPELPGADIIDLLPKIPSLPPIEEERVSPPESLTTKTSETTTRSLARQRRPANHLGAGRRF